MAQNLPPDKTADNKEIRGFSWRQAGLLLISFAVVEATLLSGISEVKNALQQNSRDIANQDIRITDIKVEQDRLDRQQIEQKGRIDNLERSVYPGGSAPVLKPFYGR